MNTKLIPFLLAFIAFKPIIAGADTATGTTTTPTSTSTASTTTTVDPVQYHDDTSYLNHIEPQYLSLAGSHENLANITNGLRTGGNITLLGATTDGTATTGSTLSFTSPTKPMGYGNITHTLDYANRQLTAAGITSPTADQLKAALVGGTVTNSAGESITMQGVLQLRSQGMGWGQIAHSLGIPPSPNSKYGIAGKSGLTDTSTGTSTHHSGITTAANTSGQIRHGESGKSNKTGIVSAGGNNTNVHQGTGGSRSGIVTAGGAGSSMGAAVGSSHSSHSITLASGNTLSGSITSANASSGHGNGYAKGKN